MQKIHPQNLKIFFGFFQKQTIYTNQRETICTHLDQFYHSNNLASKPYTSKHAFKTHVGYKCAPALIFHLTQHSDAICTTCCFGQGVLTPNTRLKPGKPGKSHLHLAYNFLYFCSFFSFLFSFFFFFFMLLSPGE